MFARNAHADNSPGSHSRDFEQRTINQRHRQPLFAKGSLENVHFRLNSLSLVQKPKKECLEVFAARWLRSTGTNQDPSCTCCCCHPVSDEARPAAQSRVLPAAASNLAAEAPSRDQAALGNFHSQPDC